MVDRPLKLSINDLNAYPRFERSTRLKCVQCWSARTTWSGFRFEELVEDVKPLAKARSPYASTVPTSGRGTCLSMRWLSPA